MAPTARKAAAPGGVDAVLESLRAGRTVIVVDDTTRENEGDLVCAAQFATPEVINFMARNGRGLICVPMSPGKLDALGLAPMVPCATDSHETGFTVSVDARSCRTGVSAYERSATVRLLADPKTRPGDLASPGHVFPLRGHPLGVAGRRGHTEAALDLVRMAGLEPVACICEVLAPDGRMASRAMLARTARRHGLCMTSVQAVLDHRLRHEKLVECVSTAELPTRYGHFRVSAFKSVLDGSVHLALLKGDVGGVGGVLVRVHSECLTGEALGSLRCDCGEQLAAALTAIEREGLGIVLYMRQEGRGIGLLNKICAYHLQDEGRDTVEANLELGFSSDERNYAVCAQILRHLHVDGVRLVTNNPSKVSGLVHYGIQVVERVPLQVTPNEFNRRYLATKKQKLGHVLDIGRRGRGHETTGGFKVEQGR